jgi:acetyl-CoA C-acetyltransferase
MEITKMARLDPSRMPVIVGIGEIKDRPADRAAGLEPAVLMIAALRAAEADAGAALLAGLDSLDVINSVTWPYADLPGQICAALGVAPARKIYRDVGGNTPILSLHEAAARIARGESQIAAVVGGESTHTATWARRNNVTLPWTPAEALPVSANGYLPARSRSYLSPLAVAHKIDQPIYVYPLYENATAAAWGQTPDQAHAESARIWSDFSAVAAANPNAWMRDVFSPEQVAAVTPDNRSIAWPYPKRMVANPAVNQGGAVLLTSVAHARSLGIPDRRMIHILGGAAATEPKDWMARDQYVIAPAQEVVLESILAQAGGDAARLAAAELYSCFPVVPKMARRKLGLAPDRVLTTAGGLTFHGAPLNNYMTHACAGMVRALRDGAASDLGLLYGQGGFVTAHHAILLSASAPEDDAVLNPCDLQHEADRRRGPAPRIAEQAAGAAEIETFTVVFRTDGAVDFGAVVLRLPDGARTLARVEADDTTTLDRLMARDATPIGLTGRVQAGAGGLLAFGL